MLGWFVRRRHRDVDARLVSVMVGVFVVESCWVDGRDRLGQIREEWYGWLRHWCSFRWVG